MAQERRVFYGRPSGMNLDIDPTLVPNGQTLERRNVTTAINGNQLVISNIQGNALVEYTLPSGSNLVIGAKDYKLASSLYVFIWNGEGNHTIYRYNYSIAENDIETLTQGPGLAFDFLHLIISIEIVNNELLIWTDSNSAIGGLDLTDYASLPMPLTAADRHYIELGKKPNPDPMTIGIGTIISSPVTHIQNKVFKFRSDYIYPLYLRTVGSTISQVAIPKTVPSDPDDTVVRDNVIYIDVPVPEYDDVQQVNLYVQSGNTDLTMGNWYKFAEIDPADLPATILYDGTKTLAIADQTEMLQPYSFIPDTAECLSMLPNNSLCIGGPTENIDADITPKVVVTPVYNARPSASAATTTAVYANSNTPTAGTFKNLNFDIQISSSPTYDTLTIGGTAKVGDKISFSIGITRSGTVPSGLPSTTAVVTMYYVVTASDTLSTIAENITKLINCSDTRPSGFGGIVAYYPGSGNVVRLIQGINDNAAPYTPDSVVTSFPVSVTNDADYVIAETKPNLKRWQWHQWGIGYGYGKNSLTPVIPCSQFYSQGYDDTTNDGWVSAKLSIMHEAPPDATDWYLYYLKQTPKFLQIWCNALQVIDIVFTDGNGTRPPLGSTIDDTTAGQTITVIKYLDGDSTYGTMRAYVSGTISALDALDYNSSSWTGVVSTVGTNVLTAVDLGDRITYDINNYGTFAQDYSYLPGDQLRFIAVDNGGTFTYYSSIPNTNIIDGDESYVYSAIDLTTLTPSVSYPSVVLVEIWRPNSEINARIWYQTGIKGEVFESSGNYYHTGTTQNQSASQGAISDVNFGDTYSRYSPNPVGFASISSDIIEALSMSPFALTEVTSIGKPAVEDVLSLQRITRPDGMYFTQVFAAQTELNGLSVVLGSSYKDYSMAYGPLRFMRARDYTLLCWFEDRVGYVGINRELILSSSGVQTYTTAAVLNSMNYYQYQGGISDNAESLATNGYRDYWVDVKRNKVLRLAGDGIDQISDYGIMTWVSNYLNPISDYLPNLQITGAYNQNKDSYVFHAKSIIELGVGTAGADTYITFPNTVPVPNGFLSAGSEIIVGDSLSGTYVVGIVESYEDIGSNQYVVTFSNAVGAYNIAYYINRIDTLLFHEPTNSWDSFHDLNPDFLSACGTTWTAFKNGANYLYTTSALYNTIFGSVVESYVDIPFNLNSATFKSFINILQEATDVWISDVQGDISTIEGQESLLQANHYTELLPERWSAAFLKDMTTPTTVAPTNPLFEGYVLSGKILIVRLKTSNTTQNMLYAVTVNPSNINL